MDTPDYSELRTVESTQQLSRHSATGPQIASFELSDAEVQLVLHGVDARLQVLTPESGALQATTLEAQVAVLPKQADRPVCFAKQGDAIVLASAESARGAWHTTPASPKVERHVQEKATTLLVWENLIVLANPRQGVLISQDRGETYRSVPGSMAVTALTAGRFQRSVQLWLAMKRELKSTVDLVLLDPATLGLSRIAEFHAMNQDEFAPAQALVWDEEGETIYVAGEFGLRGFSGRSLGRTC
jgi:hypothetical protein